MSTIPGATAAGAATQQSNAASGSTAGSQLSLASNFTTFLTLLTTQLQHQDPSNPVDSAQFTQQLVAFAGVQQQVEGNATLQKILAAVQGNQVGSASSYIGTTIKAAGNQGGLVGGLAHFGYTLSAAAKDAHVTIKNAQGAVVFEGAGSGKAGENLVDWDGRNSFNGAKEPDGVYTISVKATDAQGHAVTATPFITGVVNSASIDGGTVMLSIGALQVPTTNVTSVTNLPNTTS